MQIWSNCFFSWWSADANFHMWFLIKRRQVMIVLNTPYNLSIFFNYFNCLLLIYIIVLVNILFLIIQWTWCTIWTSDKHLSTFKQNVTLRLKKKKRLNPKLNVNGSKYFATIAYFIYLFMWSRSIKSFNIDVIDVDERGENIIEIILDHSGNLQVPMAVCFGLLWRLWPSDFDSHSLPLNHYVSSNIYSSLCSSGQNSTVDFIMVSLINGDRRTGGPEEDFIRRHHKHDVRENQCSSSLVKHIKAPLPLVSSAQALCSDLWLIGWIGGELSIVEWVRLVSEFELRFVSGVVVGEEFRSTAEVQTVCE